MDDKRHWRDWANFLLGLWVFGSPWLLEHLMVKEMPGGGILGMWNVWLVGLGVSIIATVALYAFNAWEEWVNLALGAWLLVSPWALGFSKSRALMWNAVIFGALVLVLASWALAGERGQKPTGRLE
jgi:SPW repeat